MPRSHLFLLGLIVAFAAAVRSYDLGGLGFWTDELCSLSVADGWGLKFDHVPVNCPIEPGPVYTKLADTLPASRIVSGLIRDDLHPPLYFLLLRGWMGCFGDSEAAARSLNVAISSAAVALLYFAGRPAVGSAAALRACLIMAVATPQIQMAQEARQYPLALLFCLAAAVATRRLCHRPTVLTAVVTGAMLLGMMLTHYFTAGVAAALLVYATVVGQSRRLVLLAFGGAGLIFAAGWGPFALHQLATSHGRTDWLIDPTPGQSARAWTNFIRLPVRLVAENSSPVFYTCSLWIGGFIWLAATVLIYPRPAIRRWVLWLFFAVGIIAVQDAARHTTQLYWLRYTLFASPAVYLLIASAVPFRRWQFLPTGVAVVAAMLCLWSAYVPAWKIDFRTPIQFSIGNRLQPTDALLIVGPDAAVDGVVCGAVRHYLPRVPATLAVLTKKPDERLTRRLQSAAQVWVIRVRSDPMSLPGFVPAEAGDSPGLGLIQRGSYRP